MTHTWAVYWKWMNQHGSGATNDTSHVVPRFIACCCLIMAKFSVEPQSTGNGQLWKQFVVVGTFADKFLGQTPVLQPF